MNRTIRAAWLGAALALGCFSGPMAAAGTVGGEYANQDACGNDYLPNADNNVGGYVNMMQAFGHTRRFLYGNTLYWADDLVSSTVSGGKDNLYGDTVNHLYVSSHGGSDATRFRITTGATRTIDGVSTCRAYTSNGGTQWWRLGDGSVRILNLYTCHGLQLEDLAHWNAVANGLHMITGGHENMYDSASAGSNYAFWGNMGCTVKQAWFDSVSADTTVVMAYGVSQADALNRRDHEKFSWSMARLGQHTWRAWSWID